MFAESSFLLLSFLILPNKSVWFVTPPGRGTGVTLQGLNLEGVALSDKIASARPASLQDIVLDTLWR